MPKLRHSQATPSRKRDHVELTLARDVRFRMKSTGLETWEFVNNALPEIDLVDVTTEVPFLGKRLSLPFMVSCMTGGYTDATRINRDLAEICEEAGIAMGVGSQRQALESKEYHRSFSIAREAAPSIPLVGNLGATEVAVLASASPVQRLAELIRADAFAVHLNPLQELLQPEGNTRFRGVLKGIAMLVRDLPVPVMVKEIGAGLSADVIRRLLDVGVQYIDVAGAGGTSWAGVEIIRSKKKNAMDAFWDWGIPTAHAIRDAAALRSRDVSFTLIGSGGITSGMEAAKCLALGADIVASARPILLALHKRGKKGLKALINQWAVDLRGVMFLTGSATVGELRTAPMTTRQGL